VLSSGHRSGDAQRRRVAQARVRARFVPLCAFQNTGWPVISEGSHVEKTVT